MVKGVAINVGVNTKREWGGFRGPIFSDGSFDFIHIPWAPEYGMIEPRPKKYKNMSYSRHVPDRLKDEYVAISPDFDRCTYASSGGSPANELIFNLNPGDYLLFFSTLDFTNERGKREEWINPKWGAYLVGLFKIARIWKRSVILKDEYAMKAFEGYVFYELLKRPDCFGFYVAEEGECQQCHYSRICSQSPDVYRLAPPNPSAPWIKGIQKESGLLEKAIHLNDSKDSHKWSDLAYELFRKSWKEKLDVNKQASPRIILTCEGECLANLLAKCVLRKSNCYPRISKSFSPFSAIS